VGGDKKWRREGRGKREGGGKEGVDKRRRREELE
jgi:hypothetical protein